MDRQVVVIGGVALGPKVACRLKRLDPDVRVTLVERGETVSYGGCGIPYYVGGDVTEIEGLYSTSAHVVRDRDFFQNAKGVEVRTGTEALAVNRDTRTVTVREISTGRIVDMPYDQLVLATGATPVVPPIEGIDLDGVTVVANLEHARAIKDRVAHGSVERAVVIGGGAIGIEMAEALTDLWGVETTLVEMQDQVLPSVFGRNMAGLLQTHMAAKGVALCMDQRVLRIVGSEGRVTGVETSGGHLDCDLVVLSVGVRPNTELAAAAGLHIGDAGGIRVDETMRTSDPDIYAGGDCVEVLNHITGRTMHLPLGSLANRQGRVLGTNLAGGSARFEGAVGSFCIKVFDLGAASAGLTVTQAREAGFDPVHTVVTQSDRAHFYPTHQLMYMKLIADRQSRRVLGVEAVGGNGDAVKARVDSVAALLPYRVELEAISNLEVAYSPPYASAMDIVNNAANTLENIIEGRNRPVDAQAFLDDFQEGRARVLDVRSRVQAGPFVAKYGRDWQNIPQQELAACVGEVDASRPLYLVCGSGPRSYESQLLLRQQGIDTTRNVQGGMGMILSTDPGFQPL